MGCAPKMDRVLVAACANRRPVWEQGDGDRFRIVTVIGASFLEHPQRGVVNDNLHQGAIASLPDDHLVLVHRKSRLRRKRFGYDPGNQLSFVVMTIISLLVTGNDGKFTA